MVRETVHRTGPQQANIAFDFQSIAFSHQIMHTAEANILSFNKEHLVAALSSSQTLSQGLLHAPACRRADDFVFVSSIYPIDDDGHLVHTRALSPYVGEAEVAVQTRAVLDRLSSILRQAGSSLDGTVRVEVALANAADFYEFNLVWREYFSESPPARTTTVIGDHHIVPGALLNLDAVAIVGDSQYQREPILAEGAPNPMAAEHVPQAVKAGPFVFMSGLPASDFVTGIPVGRSEGFPYYGSDAEAQAEYMFTNWQAVLKAAGTDMSQALKAQLYEVDLSTFHDVDGIWKNFMPTPPTRSSMATRDLVVPGALFVANLLFLVPDAAHQKTETRKGLRWHPVDSRRVHFTPGLLAGDWFFTAGQVAAPNYATAPGAEGAPTGLPNHFSDIELQTQKTMEMLQEQLEANDFSMSDVVTARIFLCNPDGERDFRGFDRIWRKYFPEPASAPALTMTSSVQRNGAQGVMVPDAIIEIDLISNKSR
jgi:2-aminomuconate deaminase